MRTANPMQKKCPYDVGDILQTRNAAHPSTRWPGTTWEAITTMLLGASDAHPAGSTGGEEAHTLTMAEMPKHSHGIIKIAGDENIDDTEYAAWAIKLRVSAIENTEENPKNGSSGGTSIVGESSSHNNMPPYTAVYIWERTG